MTKNIKKNCAFTLAEVLITLAIIGVVAALTIPTVVKNYQKMQLKTALKKQWGAIHQVLNKVAFDMGGAKNIQCYYFDSSNVLVDGCFDFFKNFYDEFKVSKKCIRGINNGCMPVYSSYPSSTRTCFDKKYMDEYVITRTMADGALYFSSCGYGDGNMPLFLVDVNGFAPPNKPLFDLFSFYIFFDGNKIYIAPESLPWSVGYTAKGLRAYSDIDKW